MFIRCTIFTGHSFITSFIFLFYVCALVLVHELFLLFLESSLQLFFFLCCYLFISNGLRRPCLLCVQYLQVILSSPRLLCSSTSAPWCWCRNFFCYFLNLLFNWFRFIIVISNR